MSDYDCPPEWLGLPPECSPAIVIDAICAMQEWYALPATGEIDEALYRRLALEHMATEPEQTTQPHTPSGTILVAGQRLPIRWDKVLTPQDEGGRGIERHYRKGGRTRSRYKDRTVPLRQVKRAVLHWTVTRSAAHSWRVAWSAKRSVSTHFEIDWDGTIYQLLDVEHQAYHSGIGWLNDQSVGVDLTNPVGQKRTEQWAKRLEVMGQEPRPVITGWRINGWDPGAFLGPTVSQVEALAALARGLHDHMGIPLKAPMTSAQKRLKAAKIKGLPHSKATVACPEGWVHHAQVMRGKWDHAGIYLPAVLARAQEP